MCTYCGKIALLCPTPHLYTSLILSCHNYPFVGFLPVTFSRTGDPLDKPGRHTNMGIHLITRINPSELEGKEKQIFIDSELRRSKVPCTPRKRITDVSSSPFSLGLGARKRTKEGDSDEEEIGRTDQPKDGDESR